MIGPPARHHLFGNFTSCLSVEPALDRTVVSYQGNRGVPGFRWMKYKEGFSRRLVEQFIQAYRPHSVLDPFSGIGTVPIIATGHGALGTGIEIMPIGARVGAGIVQAANGVSAIDISRAADALLRRIKTPRPAPKHFSFPHVRITEQAFSAETELEIAKARHFISEIDRPAIRLLLDVACMTVLESVSYTRKDGQYLRWDCRSGRSLRSKVDKGPIASFRDALEARLLEIVEDTDTLKEAYGRGYPNLMIGSSLNLLRKFSAGQFDMVITSPPYANRYDYTRTYALELAWLGFDQDDFAKLRQRLLSATVENKPKLNWLQNVYADNRAFLETAFTMYRSQSVLHDILNALRNKAHELSNKHVIRLLEGYFQEMAIIIKELGRVVAPGGTVIMVNDNVQYHGEEVPVDFILSDFAEQSGFVCQNIWVLPRGKGNSSQQMARFGRREIRKCVYRWVRTDERY